MLTAVKSRTLVVTLSNDDKEIERATTVDGRRAVKIALLMLAKRDVMRPGDVLRVEADG